MGGGDLIGALHVPLVTAVTSVICYCREVENVWTFLYRLIHVVLAVVVVAVLILVLVAVLVVVRWHTRQRSL